MTLINSITLNNYKSFVGEHTFDFSNIKAGLYFLTGQNLVEPRLGGNGVGKSSFSGSLCWCLYGKDEKNFRAGTIGNWGIGKDCSVELTMNSSTNVFRSWSPNTFKVDNTVTESIEPFINMSYNAFLHSILIGQDSVQFFDLEPSKKLQVFSSILDLDYWDNLSGKAKDTIPLLKDCYDHHEKILIRTKAQLESLESTDLDVSATEWEKYRLKKVTEISEELSNFIDDLEEYETYYKEAKKAIKKQKEIVNVTEKKAKKLIEEAGDLDHDWDNCTRQAAVVQNNVDIIEAGLLSLLDPEKVDTCDYCCQELDSDLLYKKREELEAELQKAVTKVKEQKKISDSVRKLGDKKNQELISIKKQLEKHKKVYNDYIFKEKTLKNTIKGISNNIDNRGKVYEDWKEEINPFDRQKEIDRDKKERLSLSKLLVESLLDVLKKKIELNSFWIRGFKDIRFMVIESALVELDVVVNNYLDKLGLENWEIKFMIDKETKSNTIKKGFDMFVKSPHSKDMVPFRAWSGGERSRLRLAGTLGMSDFITSRCPDFNVRFFDEPTAWLSPEGINDLLLLLKQKAKDDNKIIFIMDHRTFGSFSFDGIFSINKTERGSYFG